MALLASPLLFTSSSLAATESPVLESIGANCSLEREDGTSAWRSDEAAIARPIAAPNGALVTSQAEMTQVRGDRETAPQRNRLLTALRLLLNNPYASDSSREEPARLQNHCISQGENFLEEDALAMSFLETGPSETGPSDRYSLKRQAAEMAQKAHSPVAEAPGSNPSPSPATSPAEPLPILPILDSPTEQVSRDQPQGADYIK
ncbi:MAG: hypothetical protein WA885_18105 [Phormidesmis sp.]